MGDAKREIWVVDYEDGSHTWFALERQARETASANGGVVTRFAPAKEPQPKASEGWVHYETELPDSDVWVLVTSHEGDLVWAQLEFADDSEGHGEPYWETPGGELALCNYPHWRHMSQPEWPKKTDGWNLAEDKQPIVGDRVLCWSTADDPMVLDYAGAGDFVSPCDDTEVYSVSHWRPIAPPKATR